MTDDKGFTVIELMLAILIAGMIMAAVGSFLNFSMKSFNLTKEVIDVQYEAQMAINQLTDIGRESIGIIAFESGGSNELTNTVRMPVELLTFEHEIRDASNQVFVVTYVGDEILVEIDGATSYVMAEKIDSFTIEPTNGDSFETTNGIIVNMLIKDNESEHDIQTQIKFRNKE